MKKADIEKGFKLLIDGIKEINVKLDYKEDVSYLRTLDGKFLDSSNNECYILGSILFSEDPERIALLEKMVRKIVDRQNIKFEDMG